MIIFCRINTDRKLDFPDDLTYDQDWDDLLKNFIDDNISSTSSELSSVSYDVNQKVKQQKEAKRKLQNQSPPEAQKGAIISTYRPSGYIRALHVWKKDIRRKYIDMYRNVVNNHDMWLFTRFLMEFGNPHHCQFNITLPSAANTPIVLCNGISDVVYGLTQIHLKLPDCVHLLSDTSIHVPHHAPGSRIVSKMVFEGTRLFEFHDDALAEAVRAEAAKKKKKKEKITGILSEEEEVEDTSLINNRSTEIPRQEINATQQLLPAVSFPELKQSRSLHSSLSTSHPDQTEEELMSRFQSLQLYRLPVPRSVRLEGVLTLSLSATHQIEGIHFQVLQVSETTLTPIP